MEKFDYDSFLEREIDKLSDNGSELDMSFDNFDCIFPKTSHSESDGELSNQELLYLQNSEFLVCDSQYENFKIEISETENDVDLSVLPSSPSSLYAFKMYDNQFPHSVEPQVLDLMNEILDILSSIHNVSHSIKVSNAESFEEASFAKNMYYDANIVANYTLPSSYKSPSVSVKLNDMSNNIISDNENNTVSVKITDEIIDTLFEPQLISVANIEVFNIMQSISSDSSLPFNQDIGDTASLSADTIDTVALNLTVLGTSDHDKAVLKLITANKERKLNRKIKREEYALLQSKIAASVKIQSKFRSYVQVIHFRKLKTEEEDIKKRRHEEFKLRKLECQHMLSNDNESRMFEKILLQKKLLQEELKKEFNENKLFSLEEYYGLMNRQLHQKLLQEERRSELSENILFSLEESHGFINRQLFEKYGSSSHVVCELNSFIVTNDNMHRKYLNMLPTLDTLVASWHNRLFSDTNSSFGYKQHTIVSSLTNIKTASAVNTDDDPIMKSLLSWLRYRANFQTQLSPKFPITGTDTSDDNEKCNKISDQDLEAIQLLGIDPTCAHDFHALSLNVENLSSIEFLKYFTSIRKLELNVNRLFSLAGIEPLSNLQEFSANDNSLVTLEPLRNSFKLESIKVNTNKISKLDLDFCYLRILTANHNLLKEFPILNCPSLYHLELHHNRISSFNTFGKCNLSCLLHLDLSGNLLTHIDGSMVSMCQLLQTLVLSHNLLKEMPAPLYLPNLQKLWLSGNKITELSNWLPTDRNYNFLEIKSFSISHSACEPVSDTWPIFLPKLAALYLQDNLISNVNVGSLSVLFSLKIIDISFNKLKSKMDLLGLVSNNLIEVIHLHDNPIYELSKTDDETRNRQQSHESDRQHIPSSDVLLTNNLVQWLRQSCSKLVRVSTYEFSATSSNESNAIGYLNLKDPDDFHLFSSKWNLENNWKYQLYGNIHRIFPPNFDSYHNLMPLYREITNTISVNDPTIDRETLSPFVFKVLKDLQSISIESERFVYFLLDTSFDDKSKNKRYRHFPGNSLVSTSSFAYRQRQQVISSSKESDFDAAYSELDKSENDLVLCCQRINNIIQFCSNNLFLMNRNSSDNLKVVSNNDALFYFQYLNTNDLIQKFQNKRSEHKEKEEKEKKKLRIKATVRIQSLYRGFRIRKTIVGHLDDKLGYINDVTIDDEYLESANFTNKKISNYTNDYSYVEQNNTTNTNYVNSDHKRLDRKYSRSSPRVVPDDTDGDISSNLSATDVNVSFHTMVSNRPAIYSRPDTSQTDTSELTDNSEFLQNIMARHSQSIGGNSVNQSNHVKITEKVAEEWHVNDPKLLATLMKRNKKMNKMQNARINREKEKDPEFRLKKFKINAFQENNSTTSSSHNNMNSSVKPKTLKNKLKESLPAWLIGDKDG